MTKLFPKIILEKEIALISIFSCLCAINYTFGNIDFSIHNYSKLYISQATLDGIDATIRVKLFYKIALFSFLFIPSSYFILSKLFNFYKVRVKDLGIVSMFSSVGIVLFCSELIGFESKIGVNVIFFLAVFLIFIFIVKEKISLFRRAHYYFPLILCLTTLFFSGLTFVFNAKDVFYDFNILLFFIISIIALFTYTYFRNKLNISSRKVFQYLVPLSAIPLLVFVSIESQLFCKIKYGFFLPYKWLFVGSLSLLTLSWILVLRRKRFKKSSRKLFAKYFIPASLLSILIFSFYKPIIDQSTEVFELANPANFQMRLFVFHEFPLFDFLSSHMFSEQFYGIIHNLIFGFKADLAFMRYDFFYLIIVYFILFRYLKKLFDNPFLALLFLVFFPFVEILFNIHLSFGLIAFFIIQRLIQKQSFMGYFALFSTLFLLFIWRLDTGTATFFATLVYFPMIFYVQQIKIDFRLFFKAIFSILIPILLVIVLFCWFRSFEYFITNFQNALHYASADQAHAYTLIAQNFNHQFYIYHFILPFIGILIVLFIIYLLRSQSKQVSPFSFFCLNSSLFFYLLFFFNFHRGLVRHGFMETNDATITSSFIIASSLFLVSFLEKQTLHFRFISFFGVSFFLVLLLKIFPFGNQKSLLDTFFSKPTIQNLDLTFSTGNFKGLVVANKQFENDNYKDLKVFLDQNLSKNQTFIDFSNTPMLYYYCQRRVSSYFCQDLQNTIDDFTQIKFIERLDPKKVPVVIYSNYPTNWFDNTDGVNNTMRQYMISEYIYENYKPFGIINNRSIWVSKFKNFSWNVKEKDTLIDAFQTYNYKKAASTINEHYKISNYQDLKLLQTERKGQDTSDIYSYFRVSDKVASSKHVFLKMQSNNHPLNADFKVDICDDSSVIATILFQTDSAHSEYMLRISNHYFWHIKSAKYVRISKIKGVDIEKVYFYKDMRNEY